jgi:hypothetical protein
VSAETLDQPPCPPATPLSGHVDADRCSRRRGARQQSAYAPKSDRPCAEAAAAVMLRACSGRSPSRSSKAGRHAGWQRRARATRRSRAWSGPPAARFLDHSASASRRRWSSPTLTWRLLEHAVAGVSSAWLELARNRGAMTEDMPVRVVGGDERLGGDLGRELAEGREVLVDLFFRVLNRQSPLVVRPGRQKHAAVDEVEERGRP